MTSEKKIDSPLLASYAIAVLTEDHGDRMFVALDQYRNKLVWSRKYQPAVVYDSEDKALMAMQEISGGGHPHLADENAGVDLASMCVVETSIAFRSTRP
ncbi:MAG: hypothetical protein ACREXM_15305 [Gammaproteobacteria bacterium]